MQAKIKETEKLIEIINSHKTFFLTLHMVPDADACGSMLCFYEFLKRKKKEVYLYSYDKINTNLKILPHVDQIKNTIKNYVFDVAIFFECSTPNRSGIDISKFSFKKTVNIDHHKTAIRYADINIIYPDYPSTAEIIYTILKEIKANITNSMALNLYSGIITDTGRFQYSQTRPQTLCIAADLLNFDFDFQRINENFFNRASYKNLKLLSSALNSLEVDRSVGSMIIEYKDFKKYNADFTDTENIINYAMMLDEVKAAFLIKEDEEKYSVTFRSKGDIDVSKVALKFGGGGHKNASGFKISKNKVKDIHYLKERVKKCLIKELRERR